MKKEITVRLNGFRTDGTATIQFWGGGMGKVSMDRKFIPGQKKPTRKQIAKCINDGQFGCEKIVSAHVDLYAEYGGIYDLVGEYDFDDHEIPMNAKRGI